MSFIFLKAESVGTCAQRLREKLGEPELSFARGVTLRFKMDGFSVWPILPSADYPFATIQF